MKKILLTLILGVMVLGIAGCGSNLEETDNYIQDKTSYYIETDKETCVEYIAGVYRFSVRLNTYGTPMLNEECLERLDK